MTATTTRSEPVRWQSVAIPTEHGGWGLTLEPVVLGLALTPSLGGGALAVGAMMAFIVRTPLKVVLVDRWRGRRLARTRLAGRIAAVQLLLLAALAVFAGWASGWSWLIPVAIATPLILVELWFDMRSRSRRLIPELAGTIGIAAGVAAVVLAAGGDARLAGAAWVLMAARGLASIPFVRVQVDRLHDRQPAGTSAILGHLGALVLAALAVWWDTRLLFGAIALLALVVVQTVMLRRSPMPAKSLGITQMVLGLLLVAIAAGGAHLIGG